MPGKNRKQEVLMLKHNHHAGSSGKGTASEEEKKEAESQTGSEDTKTPNNEAPAPGKTDNKGAPDQAAKNEKTPEIAAGAEGKTSAPEEIIAGLEAQLAEANDQYLRKAADFENFRKRMNREKQDAIDFANQSLLLDLIQIMDDFERAIISAASLGSDPGIKAFIEGVSMIEKRLSSQLENKWGLKRFSSLGEPFDPNFHEAVQMEKSAEISDPVVKEEYYKGYTLKDRVVRSAKVKVLMPEGSGQAASNTAGTVEEKSE